MNSRHKSTKQKASIAFSHDSKNADNMDVIIRAITGADFEYDGDSL